MKKSLTFLFLVAISFVTKISAQTNTKNNTDSKKIADDFPVYMNTGNPELDGANYDKAKKEWVEKNPEKNQVSEPNTQIGNTQTIIVGNTENIDSLSIVNQKRVDLMEEAKKICEPIGSKATKLVVLKEKFLNASIEIQNFIQTNESIFIIKN